VVVRQAPEHPRELVSIRQRGRAVRLHGLDVENCHARRVATATSRLVGDGVQEEAIQPRVEAFRISQTRKIPPALDEGFLDSVFSAVDVPENEACDPKQVVDVRGHQEIERVTISFARSHDQLRVRHRSLASSPIACNADDQPYWREPRQDGSKMGRLRG
jgi:hypothetical protein